MTSSSQSVTRGAFFSVFAYDFSPKNWQAWCGNIVRLLPPLPGHFFPEIARMIGIAKMAWYASSRSTHELEDIRSIPEKLWNYQNNPDLFRATVGICRGAIELAGYAAVLVIVDIVATIFRYSSERSPANLPAPETLSEGVDTPETQSVADRTKTLEQSVPGNTDPRSA